ncbi:AAA family ATPase [Streptomyces sp. NRRL S-340]|uniref:AAA family ATPase n=1 Tax=Streptomyces sp. NRRL S-340 TaxID=1463901 RepID=UPI00099BEEEB|nr:AAA family ATPase [Streptomyces sp. NRRL S-340]
MTDTTTLEALAATLVHAREAACLTQEDLARRSGLSVRAIRNLETGHTARPRKQSLRLLAQALGLPPADVGRLLRTPRPEHRPGPRSLALSAELPAAPRPHLAGREPLLDRLHAHLVAQEHPDRGRLAVVVGPPGAGKTALILRAAHTVRARFPDGQVFVDLHPAGAAPLTPDRLVRRVLRSLGGTPDTDGPDEAGARLRDVLSRRRVLVVLDNAATEAHIRPLLVDDVRSAVLVAARRELPALPDRLELRIGALDRPDAHRVLEDLAGAARTRAERSAAMDVVESCARLPLALHIAGLWLTTRPHRSLRDLAHRLADEEQRLRFLRVGDLSLQDSVAAYHQGLPPQVTAALERLAALRGDFGTDEVTARVTPSREHAADLLDELLHRQVTHVSAADGPDGTRYRLHDAVRLYAAHCLAGPPGHTARTAPPALPRQRLPQRRRDPRLRATT